MLAGAATCLAADNGKVKFEVEPGRAGVFIDGKFVGPARNFGFAQTYEVPAGEHELWLTEPRYEDIQKEIDVTAGKTLVIKESMKALPPAKPPFGTLRTENPDHFAAVYVNKKYMGHVDEFSNFAQGLLLNPGTYEVQIAPRNGTPINKTVTIEADKTVLVK